MARENNCLCYLSIKIGKKHVDKVSGLKGNHVYDTPEIISLKAKACTEYQQWLEQTLT